MTGIGLSCEDGTVEVSDAIPLVSHSFSISTYWEFFSDLSLKKSTSAAEMLVLKERNARVINKVGIFVIGL